MLQLLQEIQGGQCRAEDFGEHCFLLTISGDVPEQACYTRYGYSGAPSSLLRSGRLTPRCRFLNTAHMVFVVDLAYMYVSEGYSDNRCSGSRAI